MVFEMEDKIKVFPEKEKNLQTALYNLHSDRCNFTRKIQNFTGRIQKNYRK